LSENIFFTNLSNKAAIIGTKDLYQFLSQVICVTLRFHSVSEENYIVTSKIVIFTKFFWQVSDYNG